MVSIKNVLAGFLFCVAATQTIGIAAQDFERDPNFKVAISQSIGLGGFTTTTQFMLVDESGFRYDTMTLLANKSVKQSLNLSDEQKDLIGESWLEAKEEMEAKLLGAITSDTKRDEVESIFFAHQAQVLSLMNEDQAERFESMKAGLALDSVGVAKFLSTKRARKEFGLTDAQVEKINKQGAEFEKHLKLELRELIRQSNQALIGKLSDEQQQALNKLLDEKQFNDLLNSSLFVSHKLATSDSPYLNVSRNHTELFVACLTRKNREQAKITDSQYDKMRELRRDAKKLTGSEFETRLNAILSTDQIDVLAIAGIVKQIKKHGSVNSISNGILANELELSDEERERLFAFGNELQEDLKNNARIAKKQLVRETFECLSDSHISQLSEIVESADPLTSVTNTIK